MDEERIERRMQDDHDTLTRLDANVRSLCQKFDAFMEGGSPRCASHSSDIEHLKQSQVGVFAWLSGVTLALIGSVFAYLFKG